jgi:winged helix DNA-binding protein
VCGIHAQIATSAELSVGLRIASITRADVNFALWRERSLVKTYGLRSTLHIFPAHEFGLWVAALNAKLPPREPNQRELEALPPGRRDELISALVEALAGRSLTNQELASEIEQRIGPWANEATFPAFGGDWPRWHLALRHAAQAGLIVAGPPRGNRVTYVRTDEWLGPLEPVDGQAALREVCRRFLVAYGPSTPSQFARWFYTRPPAARELMASLDLEEVNVEGWRAWLPADARDELVDRRSVHLLPQFDCYVLGGFPRDRLIPKAAPVALQRGTAAPFAVVLVDGIVGGLWERRRHGSELDITIDTFAPVSTGQRAELQHQAARVGAVLGLEPNVTFGPVEARAHL